jgi:hypothetical protein
MRILRASGGGLLICALLGACSSTGSKPGGAAASTGSAGTVGQAGGGATGAAAGSSGAAGAAVAGESGSAGATGGAAGQAAAGTGGTTSGPAGSGGGGSGGSPAGVDGGSAGAGNPGNPGVAGFGFSGASRCGAAGVLLCESFENGLDANTWTTLVAGEGTAVIDDAHAFRGTKAMHIKVVNQGHKAAISETKTFPIATNILYARMFVWFDTFTTGAHFTMAEAPQTAAGAWIRYGGQGGKYGVGTDHGASGDWLQQDTVPVPTKQWTCIEFELAGDTNEFHVWFDDVEHKALNVGPTQHKGFLMPPFTSLWFGWQTYSNQAPGEFWIDEIAIDSKPIGCAK